MKIPESILKPEHPSYGCDQAWFVFGVVNPRGDITRVLIVEAKNTWAVQTLERVSSKDNRVNNYCELMTVGRKCSSLGTRSDRAVEVSYIDFILDIVDPSRLIEDYYISTTFDRSLTNADREYATKKLEALDAQSQVEVEYSAPPVMKTDKFISDRYDNQIQTSNTRHKAVAALLDLGFKKQQVSQILDQIGTFGTVEETVKSALQHLYAA
jgi:hypothetical protein